MTTGEKIDLKSSPLKSSSGYENGITNLKEPIQQFHESDSLLSDHSIDDVNKRSHNKSERRAAIPK
jgi:hypothetical protein